MIEIGTQKPQGKTFAMNVAIRNPQGKVLKFKYIETDSAAELSDFWQTHSGTPRSQKKNKKEDQTATVKTTK